MKDIITHLNEKLQEDFVFKGNLKQSPYQPVDLGLSVKWCACNVGATKPEDPGLLFQWGRTDGYKYGDENHKFLSEKDYVTTSGTEYKPGDTLKLEDDAAHVNMGGKWRMPTYEETEELLELKHEWAEVNGVKGYKFTSENGNSIFIPVSYSYNGDSYKFNNDILYGYMWTSFIHSRNDYNCPSVVSFTSEVLWLNNYCYRYHGFSVRGVCE